MRLRNRMIIWTKVKKLQKNERERKDKWRKNHAVIIFSYRI